MYIVCDSLVVQMILFMDACVAIWKRCCLECKDTCVVCIVYERLVSQLMLFMDACVAIWNLLLGTQGHLCCPQCL